MSFLRKIRQRIERAANYAHYTIVRAFFLLLVLILYASILISSSFQARGIYLTSFYLLLMILPPTVGVLFVPLNCLEDGNLSRTLHFIRIVNGVLLACLVILFYAFFLGLLSWQVGIWLFLTLWAFYNFYRACAKRETVNARRVVVTSLIRFLAFLFISTLFWGAEAARFRDTDVEGAVEIPVSSVQGVSELTQKAISVRADVIVARTAYVDEDGGFIFRVAPIRQNLFSRPVYVVAGDGNTLNQVVGEMRLVSNVGKDVGGIGNFIISLFRGAWGIVKGLFTIIFHPIETVKGLYAFFCSALDTAIHEPGGLVTKPLAALEDHFESFNKELASEYCVDLNEIRLPETYAALSSYRRSSLAGEAVVEVVTAMVPAGEIGKVKYVAGAGKAKTVLKGAELVQLEVKNARRVSKVETLLTDIKKTGRVETKAEQKLTERGAAYVEKDPERMHIRAEEPDARRDLEKGQKVSSKQKIKGGGPEDQAFDQNMKTGFSKSGEEFYDEGSFQKGNAGISGRKPTPDGLSVDKANKTKTYWEKKRPSECETKSWNSTYENDPIAKERKAAKNDYEAGKITKAEQQARNVIAEHDDHYAKKGERWSDPAGVPSEGYQDKLGIKMPDSPNNQDFIEAILKELKKTGRNPKVSQENGIVKIMYDVMK
jgi:hypothetical protein